MEPTSSRTLEQRPHICRKWIETLVKRVLLRVMWFRSASNPSMHLRYEYGVRLADDTAAKFDPIHAGHWSKQYPLTTNGKTSRQMSHTDNLITDLR